MSILSCSAAAGTVCTPAGFGTAPVIGEAQVEEDGLSMGYPAEFKLDASDATQMLVGTCRVWRGPISGVGWTAANAISPVLDGTGGSGTGGTGQFCEGNALIRSMAVLATPVGEVIYVGMAGAADGGGVVAGHVFMATVSGAGVVSAWTDVTFAPVANSALAFNAFGLDVSSLYLDGHDTTGGTVYATISGFSSQAEPVQQVYRTTNGGGSWTAIGSNLPNAPVNAVVVDGQDPNTVYVGTDVGVYGTRAVGTCGSTACWAPFGTGLPLAPVTTLLAAPTGALGAGLTAGTYGRGVWQIPLATAGGAVTTAGISPASLTFGSTTVGMGSAAQTLTLKNTGTMALTVTGVTTSGAAAGDFSETDTCVGVALQKNATCALKVTFTPTAAGSRVGNLVIEANVSGGQVVAPLAGTGVATANVTLTPAGVSFGTQQVGTTSATQTVSLQNVGGSAVSVSSVVVTAPFVKVSSTCGSSLAVGTGCAIGVGFAPTQAGAAAGTLTVKDSAGTQAAVLGGTGVTGPTDTLSGTSLAFTATVLGQNSVPLTVTITNTGGSALTGIGTSLSGAYSGDFAAVSNCGAVLAAGSSCGITVTFSPSVAKTETGTLVISDALRAQNVTLTGTGLRPPVLSLSKTGLSFGSLQLNVTSSPLTLTVSNTGGSPMAMPGFSITGATAGSAASFAVGATTCNGPLAAGATCTVGVTFTPLAAGAVTATLTVSTGTLGVAAVSATLTGTGLTPATIAVSPAVLGMGSVVLGNSTALFTVQVTNAGQIAMVGPTFAVSGAQAADFALSVPVDVAACTGTLSPGATCNIQVTFTPTVVGVETAVLTVTGANAVPTTATVSLTGTGTPLILLQASASALSFPGTAVGTVSSPLTVTLSNTGRQTANGLKLAVTGAYALVATKTTCPTSGTGTLAAKSSCVVGLSFDPVASGDQPGALAVTVTNQGVPGVTVSLDGTGLAVGGLALSPTQMTFGSLVVKTASLAQTLTVTNSGLAGLTGLQVQVTGLAAGDFSLTGNTCAGVLAAGASCTTGVVFTPSMTGQRAGTVTVSTTSAGVVPGVVSLSGQGIVAGSLTATPAVVSFGAVTLGQTSPAQTVTLTNSGATALAGLSLAVTGDYSLPSNGCTGSLASGGTCSFTVNFGPGGVGTRIGQVTVSSTNAGFTQLVVGLTGTGLAAAQLLVTPGQLAFGPVAVGGNSAAQSLTVTNPGTGTLAGLLFTAGAPFSVGTGTCGAQLVAGGTCTAPVVFAPTVGGVATGTITVSSTSLGVAAVTVGVSGTGLLPASLSLTPAAVVFGGTTVGVASAGQTVTVTNPGGVGLAGQTVGVSGPASAGAKDFSVTSSTCSAALAGGGSCSVVVNFKPSVAGGRTAFLTAASTTAGVAQASTSLTGTGLTPAVLGITPGQLTFGGTLVGVVSATQTVTVKNSGQSGITDLAVGVSAGYVVDLTATTCTAVLAGGASCAVGVAFAPAAAGAVAGLLTVSSALAAQAGTAAATASLSGTGGNPPGVGFTTPTGALVQFGTTGIGQAAQAVVVTVTNTGSFSALTGLALGVDATGTANGFGLSGSTCGTTLAAGANCMVSVTFAPTTYGSLTGTLQVNSANSGQAGLALAGIGFNFTLNVVGSSSATVVQGQTGYYTLAVTPEGAGSGAVSFSCGSLPANAFCIFSQLVGLPANATGNVQLGVATGAASAAVTRSNWRGGMLLACGLLGLPLAWRGRRKSAWCWKVLLLACVVSAVSSCAGAGNAGSLLHTGGGTPPGSYSVVVTAKAAGLSKTRTVTLVVN